MRSSSGVTAQPDGPIHDFEDHPCASGREQSNDNDRQRLHRKKAPFPCKRPSAPAALTAFEAKRPVIRMPPTRYAVDPDHIQRIVIAEPLSS
jgi:hypothetical protein